MSATIHRNTPLALLPQSEPAFQITGKGQFDTGTRRFKCLTADWKTHHNRRLKHGVSDFAALKDLDGAISTGEREMFISNVSIEQQLGDSSILAVSYLGRLVSKPDDVVPGVDLRNVSQVPTGGAVNPVTFMNPTPTVMHSYLTNKEPDMFEVGEAKNPPRFASTGNRDGYYTVFRQTQTVLFEGWILKTRVPEQCGGMFRVTDTYTYEIVTQPEN